MDLIWITLLFFKLFEFGFVLCLLWLKLALRVSPAVTRLTVYRWLHIMRTVGKQATFGANIFMASEVFFRDVLRIYLSEFGKG